MVYKEMSPDKDTGWGVIYRLNDLFREVETLATSGDYDKWNYKLDRIWSNLCYREDLKIVKDVNGEIVSIEFNESSYEIKKFFDREIMKVKKEMREAKKKVPEGSEYKNLREYVSAKNKLYKIILMKEIWLRKYMRELKLYLKEMEFNPAGAMWGK